MVVRTLVATSYLQAEPVSVGLMKLGGSLVRKYFFLANPCAAKQKKYFLEFKTSAAVC